VLSVVYDGAKNRSHVRIIDAQRFEGPPVATIELPVRVPFGFHGNWIPD
jgi:carotenoid cleavage oxygenase